MRLGFGEKRGVGCGARPARPRRAGPVPCPHAQAGLWLRDGDDRRAPFIGERRGEELTGRLGPEWAKKKNKMRRERNDRREENRLAPRTRKERRREEFKLKPMVSFKYCKTNSF